MFGVFINPFPQSPATWAGHLRAALDGAARGVDLDWPVLARPRPTLVIYRGLGAPPIICE